MANGLWEGGWCVWGCGGTEWGLDGFEALISPLFAGSVLMLLFSGREFMRWSSDPDFGEAGYGV